MTDEPAIFFVQVWREGGFRASLRAVDETGLHWFDAPEPLARWLAGRSAPAPDDDPETPIPPLTGGSA